MRNLDGVQIPKAFPRKIPILTSFVLFVHVITIFEFQRPSTADCTCQKFRVDSFINLLRYSRLERSTSYTTGLWTRGTDHC